MELRSTLATAVAASLFAAGFLVVGQFQPPGNAATPAGLILGVIAALAIDTFRTLKALARRVEEMEERLGEQTKRP
jgi:hypothetical protein